jgi:membrane-associated phospholipid phosphatase
MEPESISIDISSPKQQVGSSRTDHANMNGQASMPLPIPARRSIGNRIISEIKPQEMVMLMFAALFTTIALIGHERVTEWPRVVLIMGCFGIVIALVNLWSSGAPSRSLGAFKTFYIAPLIPVFFKTGELISFPIHGRDFDSYLIAIDRMMFGVNPSQWIVQHIPLWPALTEYFTICYSLFFFLPTAVAIELFLKARRKERNGLQAEERVDVDKMFFVIAYGFLLSYTGYLLLPAIGPRFTLHNFMDTSRDMPGLLLADPLRTILNAGENILPGMTLPQILHVVTRDTFPSGHCDVTLLTIILAFKFKVRIRYVILVIGASLILSTIYLRYHYVIDLLAGALLAMITIYTSQWLRNRMIDFKLKLGG